MKTEYIRISDTNYAKEVVNILLKGGIAGVTWGHHLYILACNAYDLKAVAKMNKLKERPPTQVCAIAGEIKEIEEFVDIKKSKGLLFASRKFNMTPLEYTELLFKKFPLLIEFARNRHAPKSATFMNERGDSVWLGGHISDQFYSKLIVEARNLRKNGKQIVIVGSSLNLRGENTLTVKELDKVKKYFDQKIDVIAIHHKAEKLKKLKFTTSSSVVSFLAEYPTLLRLGSVRAETLKKYIPGLVLSKDMTNTRKNTS